MMREKDLVRLATSSDVSALARLERLYFSDAWSEAGLRSGISGTGVRYFLYERDGDILGYCSAQTVMDEGELLRIVVDETVRGCGVGSRLLEALFAGLPQVRSWYLEVRESNRAAIALYKKYGFQPIGLRKNYYRNPQEHALLMRREKVG
ncbi:ribosomal protein S18-alanine N-acetyltransferase [Hominifimenecus sp. rT4P-3]|uniref:ribosomal protein S18-alanine N-acetyltransferase n=1 Tax=Hominifimenecus sp. rT4P-3 TaxID=3242979 RepID=UPI003DA32379